jgi:opacity protein-like surface antigen
MGTLKTLGLVSLFALATVGTASAADFLPPPPLPHYAEAPSVEIGGSWYLRGDVGVGAYQNGKISYPDLAPGTYQFLGDAWDGAAFAGLGVGYQLNNWFRFDVTGEYRTSGSFSTRDSYTYTNAVGNPTNGTNLFRGNFSAAVFLANAYIDLGTWGGFTPFVGVGVGAAYKSFHGFTDQGLQYDTVTRITGASTGSLTDSDSTSLAWALMAGVGYNVTQNFKVELGYRYLNLGEGKLGRINCICGTSAPGFKIKDIESHDIKLGMRWHFAGPSPVIAPPPPLMRKY